MGEFYKLYFNLSHLISRLIFVINFLKGYDLRGQKVAQLGQIDPISEPLLQLSCGGQFLINARLNPSAKKHNGLNLARQYINTSITYLSPWS